MGNRKWNGFLYPYKQATEELKLKFKSIRNEYRGKNEYSPIEFVTGRVKEISSILEKAKKLDIPLDRLEWEMEDITGIRIMCQFVDDIDKVVEIIRNRKDMELIYEKDYIENVKASGYRSYHIIIKYPVNLAEGTREILAEIQIRTLAMNFWATIEHSLNYKYKHNLPESLKIKLKNAADTAYQLDEIMYEIKDDIRDAQKLFEIKSSLVSKIMNNVLTLSSIGKKIESLRYETELSRILDEGEVKELKNLLMSTEKAIDKYNK
ncbi:MAG: GTP pyrophosphokinase family protein [Clostridiaceae bacterium]